jgi:virginiamycin B lyase
MTTTPAGDIWYASLAGDYIGKVATDGSVTVIDPPRQRSGPRRVWSDSKGMIWSSFWQTGEAARYDPAAKSWKTWALPRSGSGTYSVYVDGKDKVWLTDFVANSIVRFDPATEKFESFTSNMRGASVRQMLGRPGEAWGGESGTDRLVVVKD